MATITTVKIQDLQKIAEEEYILMHPETDAEIVKLASEKITADNVKDALEKLVGLIEDITGGGVVTGVKGDKNTEYKIGNVSLSAEDVGADAEGTAEDKVSEHNESATAHTDIRNAVSTAQTRADEAYSLAQGRSSGTSYATLEALTAALKAAPATDFKVGDNLYIEAEDVPDYWISAVLTTNEGTYGYYEIKPLESEKVDLTDYQTKEDESLQTTSKEIVGAINEVRTTAEDAKSTAETASSKADTNATDIQGIKEGTTKVGAASEADEAAKLSTARKISLEGDATGSANFDGSADTPITVALSATGVAAGTYSAVTVDAKGRVTAGAQVIEVGAEGQTEPSSSLAIGGIFFKRI